MHNNHNLHRLRPRPGMTLLELILALALSGLLLTAIGMALHIHWRAFDLKRSRVEEAQLATAILRNISDDIRGTIKFEPPNLEGLDLSSLASNAIASAVGGATSGDPSGNTSAAGGSNSTGGGGSSGQQQTGGNNTGSPMTPMQGGSSNSTGGGNANGGGTSTSASGGSSSNTGSGSSTSAGGGSSTGTSGGTATGGTSTGSSTDAASADATAAESGPSVVVGLYGSATQLQFDVSRLPRVDQYQMQEGDDGSVQIPSDIKTVVYFLAEEIAAADGALAMGSSAAPSTTGAGRGLMRAESDRAASAYAEMYGSTDSLYAGAKMLAAEVTSLQFQYFDGTEWLTEWNSDELGGLPTAIEVVLTIGSTQTNQTDTASLMQPSTAIDSAATTPTYRMVVHLPVGGVTPSTEESTETTETTDPNMPAEETTP